MSKSGRYAYDPVLKQVVKISDTPYIESALGADAVWFPRGASKYYDAQAARTFHSKSEKRAWMKEKGVREIGGGPNPLRGLAESRERGSKVFVNV